MHDDEPDTFEYRTLPERLCEALAAIGVDSSPNELGAGASESGDPYGRYFASAPRMFTSRGSLRLRGSNADEIQIVQKG